MVILPIENKKICSYTQRVKTYTVPYLLRFGLVKLRVRGEVVPGDADVPRGGDGDGGGGGVARARALVELQLGEADLWILRAHELARADEPAVAAALPAFREYALPPRTPPRAAADDSSARTNDGLTTNPLA